MPIQFISTIKGIGVILIEHINDEYTDLFSTWYQIGQVCMESGQPHPDSLNWLPFSEWCNSRNSIDPERLGSYVNINDNIIYQYQFYSYIDVNTEV